MPEIYTGLTAPTQVTHSLALPFTSAAAQNLVVAKTSLLQIFTTTTQEAVLSGGEPSLNVAGDGEGQGVGGPGLDRRVQDADPDDEQGEFAADLSVQRGGLENVTKLVLVAEYSLYGFVTGLQRIKMLDSRSGGEALLVAFADAKLSLLEWDPEIAAVSTISLHSYERDEFQSPVISNGLPSTLIADPGSRCAALKFAGDMLAILPFRRREDEDLAMDDVGVGNAEDVTMMDGEEDDWDPTVPDELKQAPAKMNGTTSPKPHKKRDEDIATAHRPYNPSFVVSAAQLDDQIEHIISLTFLHEYREPTFGILYSPRRTWTGMLAADGRRDTCAYIVITLDLEQKASTPIQMTPNLPYDIFKVIALAPPIGGSLLVGSNELIHVDQAGKTTGVAVNTFTKRSTQFGGLADQSDLALALEGSTLVELEGESGDLLLITKTGLGVIVGFKMDGRNVSGLKITKMAHHPSSLVGGRTTTAVSLGSRRLFVGCSQGDARILKWKRRAEKKKSAAAAAGLGLDGEVLENVDMEDVYNMMDDLEEDDLYGSSGADALQRKDSLFSNGQRGSVSRNKGEYVFTTHDRLKNFSPLRDITMGKPTVLPEAQERQRGVMPELEIVAASGPTNTTEDAGLTIMRRRIGPTIVGRFDFEACKALWTVRARAAGAAGEEQLHSADSAFDRFLFVGKDDESQVFRVGDTFEEVRGTEFDAEGGTVEVGIVGEEQRIVQVVGEYVRVYDCDLNLTQIVPMFDEETGEEGPAISRARVCDPYVMLLRVDNSVVLYKLDKSMELQEEDMGVAKDVKYLSGSLYEARSGIVTQSSDNGGSDYVIALLTTEGTLQVFNLKDMQSPIFVAEHFDALPLLVAGEASGTHLASTGRRPSTTEDIAEILLADLGDEVAKEPYLIIRSALEDITLYKLFLAPSTSTIRFTKIPQPNLPAPDVAPSTAPFRPMAALPNVASHACVFLPGSSPSFILKPSHALPRLHPLAGAAVRSLAPFHTASADRGFVYVDELGVVRVSLLPAGFTYEQAWSARKVALHECVRAVSYFAPMDVYVVSSVVQRPFGLEEEDCSFPTASMEEGDDQAQAPPPLLHPTIESGALAVVNPATWTVVDQHEFAYNETALVASTLSLEVSEHTKARAPMLCAGTAIVKGEDNSARGAVYVFEVIEVVPEVGRPETNRKLKLVAREEVKGVVSALTGVNGYLLAAQGQKIMVRGLKEDQSLLPVAFMDVGAWVQSVKTLAGMVLGGEAGGRGVWFAGFSEEPYKITLFGKDTQPIETVATDFLPDGNSLYFCVADAEANLHILQFDPEHPKSLSGQRLLRRAAFHTGHETTTLTRLPHATAAATADPDPDLDIEWDADGRPQHQLLLLTTRTGALATLHALPETTYRRLNILAGQIVNAEAHAAGLNPRAYRYVDGGGGGAGGVEVLRSVLDGNMVARWVGLVRGRRKEVADKSGADPETVRADWRALGAAALAYL